MRVALTGPADRFAEAARPFAELGLEPVALACIRIEPGPPEAIEAARRAASDADLVVITSTRALEAVWDDSVPDVRFAAVGAATAAAIRERGGRVETVGSAGAHRLVDELLARVEGTTMLYPRGDRSAATPVERLTAGGATVVAPIVYRTVQEAPGDDPVDAAAFASPSAVEGWCAHRSLPRSVSVIGPTTRDAAVAGGATEPVVADSPTFHHLAAATRRALDLERSPNG